MTARVSCSEFSFPAIPSQADRIAVVRALGFDLVDVALFANDDASLVADPTAIAAGVRLALQTQALSAPDVFYATGETFDEIAPNPRDSAARARRRQGFAAAAEVAAQLGAKGMTILPGTSWAEDPDGAWACCVEELGWRVERAGQLGVEVRIEAHTGGIAALPEQAVRLFGEVPGLRLTLDVSHFELQSVPLERVLPLVPFASHMHVRAAKSGAIQIPWRDNEIDFPRVLDALAAAGYGGAFCVEYRPMAKWRCDELDALSESDATRRWLNERGVY
jgi:sugar phosphate isomerase/epimerase